MRNQEKQSMDNLQEGMKGSWFNIPSEYSGFYDISLLASLDTASAILFKCSGNSTSSSWISPRSPRLACWNIS